MQTIHLETELPTSAEIDAGALTGAVAVAAKWIFRYRQRRWRKLVRNHLMPTGPRYATRHHQRTRHRTTAARGLTAFPGCAA